MKSDTLYFQSSFNRPNLFYEVKARKKGADYFQDLADLIQKRFKNQCGIIYCATVKACEKVSEGLRDFDI